MGPTEREWLGEESGQPHQNQMNGSGLNTLPRREPRWDGEGRRGRRDRLVEGGNECNDPKEDEGAEARRAVHRLAKR